ncbi:MAG: GIY-YIG nuclease family protein [Planctomycetes bacterium]|nr:GIY-YIG nuclease family protein [Planctomycetota bacterium]
MKKTHIIAEIQRTAAENAGVAFGFARFEAATGIKLADWFGIYWARWGDALREAGFEPNQMQGAYGKEELFQKYAELAKELGCLPVKGDLRMKRRADPAFPSWNTFDRLGTKLEFVRQLAEFCRCQSGFENVVEQCEEYIRSSTSVADKDGAPPEEVVIGYVYLLKHGSRREYKIGRTNNRLRREGEIGIELPEKIEPIHVIETDDPAGIETYWHRRFADKRLKNEWFALTASDVRAFKRWRRIC